MTTVTVSSKYQVVIPHAVRKAMNIRPGQQMVVFDYGGRIKLIPVKHPREMRGFLTGIDTVVERDPDRV
jgi:AbrB family looped-hinge helix DNA binding protein